MLTLGVGVAGALKDISRPSELAGGGDQEGGDGVGQGGRRRRPRRQDLRQVRLLDRQLMARSGSANDFQRSREQGSLLRRDMTPRRCEQGCEAFAPPHRHQRSTALAGRACVSGAWICAWRDSSPCSGMVARSRLVRGWLPVLYRSVKQNAHICTRACRLPCVGTVVQWFFLIAHWCHCGRNEGWPRSWDTTYQTIPRRSAWTCLRFRFLCLAWTRSHKIVNIMRQLTYDTVRVRGVRWMWMPSYTDSEGW